ncbi:cytochrome c biogenesis CcdA family protein [Caldalkalibacillus mannanilyticus]|uniref:cytochrome c biogenesis CcdA family protein n=1 Tax=Caldalkalibacillus mannanilyticus TaxID=1418 RepID=UPI00046834FD|nr:cytochrome c biogenesis protein CcdA [Caldalkalibacillus mannanilyticus]
MDSASQVTLFVAFGAGILSFISPCTLPLYPAYLSYITGVSVKDMQENKNQKTRMKIMLHTFFFLLGISFIYLALGFGASFAGQFFITYNKLIQQLSGILLVVMGLFLIGFFKMEWLMREKRIQFSRKPVGYLGSVFIGMGFAAGWTPCVGPILSAILALSASNPSQGIFPMLAYTFGFSLPFFVLSFFIGTTKWIVRYSAVIMKVGGVLMVIMGILLYTDLLTKYSVYILKMIQGTWLDQLG